MLQAMKKRYSVRNYAQIPVEEEKITTVLEAARLAPTARNMQPWKVYVAINPSDLQKLRTITPCAYDAPVVLICCSIDAIGAKNDLGESYAPMDTTIAATHMALAATEQGLGSCIVGSFNEKDVAAAFAIQDGEHVQLLVLIGYPAQGTTPADGHAKRKPLSELVVRL